MAAGSIKYGQNSVYGSLAYDFDNPELYPEIEYGLPLEKPAAPNTQERTHTAVRTRTRARTKQGISLFAITGMLAAAVLFAVVIMAQVQLLAVTDGSAALEQQLAELETEQAKLQIKYESVFNLTEIEEYATTQLGMQKPRSDQVYYIDTSSPDRAVVVQQADSDSLVDRVSDFISGFGEYLK